MELPGVEPGDVRLSLENNILTIRGEKKQQAEENNERVHRFERTYGMFERTFALPNTVDPERIEARYENGVLIVSIPKAERAKPREIRVNTSASSSGSAQVRTGAQSQSQRVGAGSSRREGGDGSRDPEEEGSAAKSRR
jgi:HSP20 family protein